MKLHHLFCTFLLLPFSLVLKGQSLDDAKNWYLEGKYTEALPILQAEYINSPDNPSLNQWLGASLFETGRLKESEKYLSFASQKNIPEAYIYLGELYSKMYRFEDAEKEFAKYQRAKRRDKAALAKLEEKREYAERLKRAIKRTEDIQIIDSLIVPKSDFLKAYNLSASAGSVLPLNEFFKNQTETDKTLYMNERKDKIYYSQGDPFLGYSLFTMEKLLDTFGNEKKLPESVNGAGNQAYPFVMPDGTTIYFASTGHDAFGGYDLFVTRYNIGTDTYLTPNHLNTPFNSPFNDYMMAIDEEKGIGWFASDRFQPSDSVCVYTFIPNSQVTLIESEDQNMLAHRAIISSITDTWKEGVDYAPLIAGANQRQIEQQRSTGDFTFVINDQITYHSLNDFRNTQARNLFSQALELEKKLQSSLKELNNQRDQFANGGSTNATLRSSILSAEIETENFYKEAQRLKFQARNEEIRSAF